MKTAAVYIRVSTDDQTEYSPDAQLKAAREYAIKNDMIIDDRFIFIDEGISGKSTKKRSSFNRMIGTAKMKPKPFDVILLWKFSRFARNREDSIVYKSMLRRQLGIDVISITENIGDDKMSVLIEAFIEAMDEYYSINLAEEVKKGMTEKATRGEYQSSPPLGYRKLPGQPLQIFEDEAKYIRFIFNQYQAGLSFFAIASKLNDMGFRTKKGNKIENRTVEYILNNPMYKGYVRWTPTGKVIGNRNFDSPDTIIRKSNHEPIIDENTFDDIQRKLLSDRLRRSTGSRPAETKKHYLSGILKCGSCGSTLSYSHANDGFQCIKYAHGTCKPSHFIAASKIENVILEELDRLSSPGVYIENVRNLADHTSERNLIRDEIDAAEKMFDRAKRAYLAGIDTLQEYETNKAKIQTEIDTKKAELKNIPLPIIDQKKIKEEIATAVSILKSDAMSAQKNSALSKKVEKIVFYRPGEKIRIYFYT